jgi:hypothetical protein
MSKKQTDLTTTRQQLRGYGASSYQARVITKDIEPVGQEGRSNAYLVQAVITSIRDYLQNPRVRPRTQQALNQVLNSLLERLGNVVEMSFEQGADSELSRLTRQLAQAMSNTDRVLADLKATAATIKGKNKN